MTYLTPLLLSDLQLFSTYGIFYDVTFIKLL